jgi:hypothetical protein
VAQQKIFWFVCFCGDILDFPPHAEDLCALPILRTR